MWWVVGLFAVAFVMAVPLFRILPLTGSNFGPPPPQPASVTSKPTSGDHAARFLLIIDLMQVCFQRFAATGSKETESLIQGYDFAAIHRPHGPVDR